MSRSSALTPLLLLALCVEPTAWGDTVPSGCNCSEEAVDRDFDGDGSSDIVAVSDSWVRINLMQGVTVLETGFVSTGGGAFALRAVGDLDGDSMADLVFEGSDLVRIDLMEGLALRSRGFVSNGGGTYRLAAVGDLDGDGADDLVFNSDLGLIRVDLMNGTSLLERGFVGDGGGAYPVSLLADVNGDGNQDLVSNGPDFVRIVPMNGTRELGESGFLSNAAGTFLAAASGDANADGLDDLFFTSTALDVVRIDLMDGWQSIERGYVSTLGGHWPLWRVADLSGDDRVDLNFVGGSILRSDFLEGVQVTTSLYSFLADVFWVLGIGDFNGDGRSDILCEGSGLIKVMVSDGETGFQSPGYVGTGAGAFRLFP